MGQGVGQEARGMPSAQETTASSSEVEPAGVSRGHTRGVKGGLPATSVVGWQVEPLAHVPSKASSCKPSTCARSNCGVWT